MKKFALGMLLGAAAICTPTSLPAQVARPEAKPKTAADQAAPARYSAATFFNTTSYGVAAAAGFGFSPDGKSLLITSDQNGVFNAYSLPIDGGSAVAITQSTDNATFPASYFPKDNRVLFTADYIHRGIANRQFERKFGLADFVKVAEADLKDGLLSVELIREIPEAMRPRKVAIGGGKQERAAIDVAPKESVEA